MMRRSRRKDPSLVGKFSSSKLDFSLSMHKELLDNNTSALLPTRAKAHGKILRREYSDGLPNLQRKPSIMHGFEFGGDSPLPQIKVSFSKIY